MVTRLYESDSLRHKGKPLSEAITKRLYNTDWEAQKSTVKNRRFYSKHILVKNLAFREQSTLRWSFQRDPSDLINRSAQTSQRTVSILIKLFHTIEPTRIGVKVAVKIRSAQWHLSWAKTKTWNYGVRLRFDKFAPWRPALIRNKNRLCLSFYFYY